MAKIAKRRGRPPTTSEHKAAKRNSRRAADRAASPHGLNVRRTRSAAPLPSLEIQAEMDVLRPFLNPMLESPNEPNELEIESLATRDRFPAVANLLSHELPKRHINGDISYRPDLLPIFMDRLAKPETTLYRVALSVGAIPEVRSSSTSAAVSLETLSALNTREAQFVLACFGHIEWSVMDRQRRAGFLIAKIAARLRDYGARP